MTAPTQDKEPSKQTSTNPVVNFRYPIERAHMLGAAALAAGETVSEYARNAVDMRMANPQQSAPSNTRIIALVGGSVTLTVTANIFALTDDDLTLLRNLGAVLDAYERQHSEVGGIEP